MNWTNGRSKFPYLKSARSYTSGSELEAESPRVERPSLQKHNSAIALRQWADALKAWAEAGLAFANLLKKIRNLAIPVVVVVLIAPGFRLMANNIENGNALRVRTSPEYLCIGFGQVVLIDVEGQLGHPKPAGRVHAKGVASACAHHS